MENLRYIYFINNSNNYSRRDIQKVKKRENKGGFHISEARGLLNALILISAIIFVASVVAVSYTASEIASRIKIGEVDYKTGAGYIELQMPINITNPGILPISDILLSLKVSDVNGTIVFEGMRSKITLFPRESQTIPLKVRMNLSQLSEERLVMLMTKIKGFITITSIQATIQPFVKFNVAIYGKMDWEPPYGDLEIKGPVIDAYNETFIRIQMPVAFKNRSSFLINGSCSLCVTERGGCVGYGETDLKVKPTEEYDGKLEVKLEAPWTEEDPELLLHDLKREYNITLIFPAPLMMEFKIIRNITIDWGAPISDLRVGKPLINLYNDTHIKVLVPINFLDGSLLPISGSLKSLFIDGSGNLISESAGLPFKVEPGERYFGVATGYVAKSALQNPLRMDIILNTTYGAIERSVWVSG